ncbi:ketopantoate hydroxymethyltransferase [Paenibacillus chungangensis]|uniref:Ketopantoate hydroxymethyltransferase n=1 Tax=Paenibacillus chungangensis TaxID=696535 RepID=A0ABW3HQV8_9BACL
MIQLSLLQDVAEYVRGRVDKVVLNGSYEIRDFQVKQVTGETLALNYLVPVADVQSITLVELKDASDTVLTAHTVNVPITADHLMLQTIKVEEVAASG